MFIACDKIMNIYEHNLIHSHIFKLFCTLIFNKLYYAPYGLTDISYIVIIYGFTVH